LTLLEQVGRRRPWIPGRSRLTVGVAASAVTPTVDQRFPFPRLDLAQSGAGTSPRRICVMALTPITTMAMATTARNQTGALPDAAVTTRNIVVHPSVEDFAGTTDQKW
jgi:hypothetical protein